MVDDATSRPTDAGHDAGELIELAIVHVNLRGTVDERALRRSA
jgi:hypothetical protein